MSATGERPYLCRTGIPAPAGRPAQLRAERVRLIRRGWVVIGQIERLRQRLAEIDAELVDVYGPSVELVVPGVCRVSIGRRTGFVGESSTPRTDVTWRPER